MIAIIPARGGSKGLPGKNIIDLCGIPLIAHTIQTALKARTLNRIIVSTDDPEIAQIALRYKAEVPFLRPKKLATDEARAINTYLHVIDTLGHMEKRDIKEIVVLLPTSPLRLPEDIDNACDLFNKKNADSVISYTKEHHPVSWHKYLDNQGRFIDIFPENNLRNRQELEVSYFPNGSVYIFRTELLRKNIYYSENSFAYLMPRERSVDIDSIDDLKYAEFLIKNKSDAQL